MSKQLSEAEAGAVADAVLELIEDLGFSPAEALPGLAVAAWRQAQGMKDANGALDEFVAFLDEALDID